MSDAGEQHTLLTVLSNHIREAADALGVELHAVVLVGSHGTMALEGATDTDHRDAIVTEIRHAADHLALMTLPEPVSLERTP